MELMHPDNLSQWVNGLVKIEHMSGVLWEEGSTYDLYFKIGGLAYKVTETFVTRNLPENFSCIFEEKSSTQTSENWLKVVSNDQTRWVSTQVIIGTKISTKLMLIFMPWLFKSTTKRNMTRFKNFAETQ